MKTIPVTFSSSLVGGMIASGVLQELKRSNFTFSNFPEVVVLLEKDQFKIHLSVYGTTTDPVHFDREAVCKEVRRFILGRTISQSTFQVIVTLISELETRVRRHNPNSASIGLFLRA